ncbi:MULTISPECIES: metalloprotease family protein [Gracilibacillus]|uniref:metalloprotease family protein n=1 Tax=Gracilibacillus TaxID=74385 RepID=UPI0008262AC4|nr:MULTISPECIES: metalloprotease family protein [Gracilibacillus]
MNCWDSISVGKQLGLYRSILLSILLGLFSFIILYLGFHAIHQEVAIQDTGWLPLIIVLALLPLLHKVLRILPIKLAHRQVKFQWKRSYWFFPNFQMCYHTKIRKSLLLFALITPTIVIVIPCLVASYLLPSYYLYFLIISAITISLSWPDYIYIHYLRKAPKKCMVSNDNKGYNILVHQ